MESLSHIDLFSGIGGFALAARWAGIETVQFVEIDPFCQKVLRKNFPGVPIHADIKTFHYREVERWPEYVQTAKLEKSQEKENPIANHAIQNELPFGEPQILNGGEQQTENGAEKRRMKLSTITGGSASVVEKQQKSSLPLTTNITTEMQNGDTINPKHGKSLSSEDSPMIIKSSATTATTQGRIMGSAHTRGPNHERILLTAGVPCQPASCAGKRRGASDDRWLWEEAIRVLAEVKPTWAIFENVAGLLSLESGVVFDNLLSQVENQGYEVQAFIIPACSLNAPHRRDRVWIVAHSTVQGLPQPGLAGIGEFQTEAGTGIYDRPEQQDSHAPDTECLGWEEGAGSRTEYAKQITEGQNIRDGSSETPWDEPWLEVATRLCTLDDGLPGGLVRPKGWRVNALKAAGNAVLPLIPYILMRYILEIENGN